MLALCGDLWDYPEKFKTDHLLIGGSFYFQKGGVIDRIPFEQEQILIVDVN